MSGNGGGVIIIQNLRDMADTVRDHCGDTSRLDTILEKDDGDWKKDDVRHVLKCIGNAVGKLFGN